MTVAVDSIVIGPHFTKKHEKSERDTPKITRTNACNFEGDIFTSN